MTSRIAASVAIALLAGACSGSGAANSTNPGMELYERQCAVCHAADGTGASGPAIVKSSERYTRAEMTNLIRNGQGTMPGAPGLSEAELDQLVAYVVDNL